MQIGTKVRYKLAFCLATNPQWYSPHGVIVKLEPNRQFFIATIIWDSGNNPQTTFTFNLEKL